MYYLWIVGVSVFDIYGNSIVQYLDKLQITKLSFICVKQYIVRLSGEVHLKKPYVFLIINTFRDCWSAVALVNIQ